jgi:uncharacterized protein (TIGR03435 family)
MMRATAYLTWAALLPVAAFCQSTEPVPTFEVADVQVSPQPKGPIPFMNGPFLRGGRYELRYATMVDLIRTAYSVDADKVLGGPNWLEMDRFDVTAKAPGKPTPEALKNMLQALLADRFKLVVHKDTKPMPAYALITGKHPALKKSDGSGDSGCKFTIQRPGQQGGAAVPTVPMVQYTCRNMTMAAFVEGIRAMPMARQYLNGNPVLDRTELQGAWDFEFKYSLRGPAAVAGDLVTLGDAIEKQLGLKLEAVKVPMAVVVVDSVNQKPGPNPPGVTEALNLTAAPTEFEVADVKPSDPESKGMRFDVKPGGRVNLAGVTLKILIQEAWSVSDDMIVGAPKWLDSDRFDIVAKAPAAAQSADLSGRASPGSSGPPIDFEILAGMLRSLLKERFKLEVHTEDRPMPAYTLVATKPKMKKSDPASRTRFMEGPAQDGKDPRNSNPALSRLVTVQNMTMAQFAAQLQRIAPGYIHSPVLDATGLEGAYDFTLSFSPAGMMQRAGAGRGGRGGDAGPLAGGPGEASDPTGAISLPEAIEKELGLKLELQKRPIPVLVIDHIERTPTEN